MEALLDPYNDRVVSSLEAPPSHPLSDSLMWKEMDMPDWEMIRDHLKKEGKLEKEQVMRMGDLILDIIKKEPNLIHVSEPIWVVGDIHGQYYDLCHLIEKAGKPKKINYLFMGDYVDRGIFSMEVIILLFALKLNFPQSLFLLRGNHEWRNMTQYFTFREEAIRKFDEEVYTMVMAVFDAMPLAAIVNK